MSTESDDTVPQNSPTAVLGGEETDYSATDQDSSETEFEWEGRFDEEELPSLTGIPRVNGKYHCYLYPCEKNYPSRTKLK